jgi:putative spermidine/putrescine transport system substrate-binding protein
MQQWSRRALIRAVGAAPIAMVAPSLPFAALASGTVNLADIGVGDPGSWALFTKESGSGVNLVAIGNAPSAILNVMVAGGGTTSYDLINIVGGMQKPLVDNKLIVPIDTARISNWSKDSYIEEYLAKGRPGFDFIGYKGQIFGVPSVLQGDSFAYLPDKTGKLDSYGALFDPKWRGYVALEDNYTTAGQKTALYLQRSDKAHITDPANMAPDEIKTVVDFLIDLKKKGQFRVLWSSFQQAVDLITSQEVYVIDCWEPMVFAAQAKGVNAVYADPKEGYLLWAMAAYMVNNPDRSAATTKTSYDLLNFMLGGWYGAKITLLRGYMTNPDAPTYAKAHPNEFTPAEAQKIDAIANDVRHKFEQGGTWQNRWPAHVDAYESEWARFKAA